MHEQNDKFSKEIETIRTTQSEILELENMKTELKNPIEFPKQTRPCRRNNQQPVGLDI